METVFLEDDETPAFPSARRSKQLQDVLREIERHRREKERRGHLSIEDRALHFRVERILNGD
jgi:hypothetical protein